MSQPLVLTRIFDAPRELVWKAWTEPEAMQKWWGPKGFSAPVIKMEAKAGAKYHWLMRGPGPDGKVADFWTTGIVKEVVPMDKLVYTDSFSNENGDVLPASSYGMPGDWPDELLVTVKFTDEGGKTKMELTHEGLPEGQGKDMTAGGWNESFDKLADSLK